jgi:uncharacterized RDD family membrane protein YckC
LLLDAVPAFAPVVAFAAAADRWWDRGHGGETDVEPWAGVTIVALGLWPSVYFALRQTLGKRALRLSVDGSSRRRWLRGTWTVLPLLSALWPALLVPLLVDAVWPFWDRGRSLHDRLARTRVLRPVRESPVITRLRRAGAEARRAYAEEAFAIAPAAEDEEIAWSLDRARERLAQAADDPYAAQETWSYVERARISPVVASLTEEQAEDPDYVDPGVEAVLAEVDEAERRALDRFAPPLET